MSFSEDLIAYWDPTTYSNSKSILPEKIITVIGKESSGTTFVARTIAQSMNMPGREKYRDGFFHQERRAYDDFPVQVQHVSLPQGAWCLQNHSHHIVDVILPAHCVSTKSGHFPSREFPHIKQQCDALLNGTGKNVMQMYEGMVEMHGPWFMKRHWKNNFYYKAGRFPGRAFTQSEQARSRNVTIFRGKREKRRDQWEERMQKFEERRSKYRNREPLLEGVFENPDSSPEPKHPDEGPPPLVIQRGSGKSGRNKLKDQRETWAERAKRKHDNPNGDFALPEPTRRLGEVSEETAVEKDVQGGPIRYRFEGGEVRRVNEAEGGDDKDLQKKGVPKHRPPRHRGFHHEMSGKDWDTLTKDQQEELKRRMRIAEGLEEPNDDGPLEEGREETQNERLRRENRERKREMLRRDRGEKRFRPENDDDGPKLHGKPVDRMSRQQRIDDWLNRLKLYPLEHLQQNNLLMYPDRFLLNITAQKIWYDAHGTEQVIVIVVRDPKMSLQSRLQKHCHILEVAKEEEAIANAILNDAIQTFFLNDKSGFRSGFGGRWYGKTVEEIKQEALLWDPTPIIENKTVQGDPLYSSMIPASNNVVLVSYEAMMKYKQDYVKELYKVLGIQSNFQPVFLDGNAKYRNETRSGSIGRRPGERALYMDEGYDEDDGHGFFFHWLLRQPEEYQGIILAVSCASVFVGSFSLWVFIFWLFFRRAIKKRKSSRGRRSRR